MKGFGCLHPSPAQLPLLRLWLQKIGESFSQQMKREIPASKERMVWPDMGRQ
jgi:hypothetical protein